MTDLEKLARFCTTFAMRVSVRDVCSSGYSWVRLKSDGDIMAGHRKRKKREPLMRRSAMSSRPRSAQRTLQEAKTSFSSRGKTLQKRIYNRIRNKLWKFSLKSHEALNQQKRTNKANTKYFFFFFPIF